MKALFLTSLTCALMSLLALLAFSIITIVPTPGAEQVRAYIMFTASAFFIGWLTLAWWARPRPRTSSPSPWLTRSLTLFGTLYSLAILFGVIA